MWIVLQYRRGYKSLIESTPRLGVAMVYIGRETRERTGGIATKMSLSVSPCAYFDGPTITFRTSFRVVHPWEYRASPLRVSGAPDLYSISNSFSGRALPPFLPSVSLSPSGKFRYTRRRKVTREIKAVPLTCPAFQYVSVLSSADLAPDSASDFARGGASRHVVVTFQFVPSEQIYRTTFEITLYWPPVYMSYIASREISIYASHELTVYWKSYILMQMKMYVLLSYVCKILFK